MSLEVLAYSFFVLGVIYGGGFILIANVDRHLGHILRGEAPPQESSTQPVQGDPLEE